MVTRVLQALFGVVSTRTGWLVMGLSVYLIILTVAIKLLSFAASPELEVADKVRVERSVEASFQFLDWLSKSWPILE